MMKNQGKIMSSKKFPQKRLYTIKEASVYLGRTVWGVRELIWSGRMPYLQEGPGAKIFIDQIDLDAYIERLKQQFI